MTEQIPPPSRPAHEPWSARQRRAAMWAGFLGLNVTNPGVILVLAAVFSEQIAVAFAGWYETALSWSDGEFASSGELRLWLLCGGVAGVVIVLAGLLTSVSVLRARGVRRPWVVTWSAFGLSVPVLLIASTVVAVAVSVIVIVILFDYGLSLTVGDQESAQETFAAVVAVVVVIALAVVGVVVLGLIGSLIWWWMAYAFRERMPADAPLIVTDVVGAAE